MSSLIDQTLRDVDETVEIGMGFGIASETHLIFERNFPGKIPVIIADENTYLAAGKMVLENFVSAGKQVAESIIYPRTPQPYANFDNVLRLEEQLKSMDVVPVVVGSGTLNDLTKLASHHLGRKYMVVCTAASMDGYTASGASISKDGFKQTFACPAPMVVVADLDVISKAPLIMTASGYGDLLGKIVAGADWIIADTLGLEPINQYAWDIVQKPLRNSTANPERLIKGDSRAFEQLVEGLMMSGLSLQYYKSSRPASGAEHLISHLWEMQETTHGVYSHGLKVGLASIATAALFEQLLAKDMTKLDIEKIVNGFPTRDQAIQSIREAHPNPILSDTFIDQYMAKYIDGEALAKRLAIVKEKWTVMRERLVSQLISAKEMQKLLRTAGAIPHPNNMEKSLQDMRKAYGHALQIRGRYTVLDLALETGNMETCLDELFSPGGFWAEAKVD